MNPSTVKSIFIGGLLLVVMLTTQSWYKKESITNFLLGKEQIESSSLSSGLLLLRSSESSSNSINKRSTFFNTYKNLLQHCLVKIHKTKAALNLNVGDGISFTRSINILTDDFSVYFGFDNNHCDVSDVHGDNKCHYDWGETLDIDLNVNLKNSFQDNDRVHGSLKVDYFVSWNFDCSICGEDCVMTIPVVNYDVKIPMPPCPLGTDGIPSILKIPLGDSSPFEGVPLHVEGKVFVKKNNDEVIANSDIKVDIK